MTLASPSARGSVARSPSGVPVAASLPEAISYSGHGVTVVEERELWDMPGLLILLMALVGTEWAYRRSRGLA